MIRVIYTFLILLLLNISSFSQSKSAKIEFKIEYELIEELESQRSTLSNKMIIYMNDGFSRKEEVTRIGSQVLINDINNNQSFLLMQIAEEKLAAGMHVSPPDPEIPEGDTTIQPADSATKLINKRIEAMVEDLTALQSDIPVRNEPLFVNVII